MMGWPQMTSEWRHVQLGFAGRAIMPTILKIEKNVENQRCKIMRVTRLLSRISIFYILFYFDAKIRKLIFYPKYTKNFQN